MGERVRIGTSGWEYDHWKGDFYPAKLPRRAWFDHYAAQFDCVELNATFYRLPDAATFGAWADRAPDGFSFAVKGSRYLTHVRRLREPVEPIERLWSRARRLGPRLGPILYQLPPRWKPNLERLEAFLDALPAAATHVIEIRDFRWYRPEVLAAIRDAGASLCLHDMEGSATNPEPVGPIAYVRFHGSGQRYGGGVPIATARGVGRPDGGLGRRRYRGLGVLQQRCRRTRVSRRGSTARVRPAETGLRALTKRLLAKGHDTCIGCPT